MKPNWKHPYSAQIKEEKDRQDWWKGNQDGAYYREFGDGVREGETKSKAYKEGFQCGAGFSYQTAQEELYYSV